MSSTRGSMSSSHSTGQAANRKNFHGTRMVQAKARTYFKNSPYGLDYERNTNQEYVPETIFISSSSTILFL